jgi:hypothetical protein
MTKEKKQMNCVRKKDEERERRRKKKESVCIIS